MVTAERVASYQKVKSAHNIITIKASAYGIGNTTVYQFIVSSKSHQTDFLAPKVLSKPGIQDPVRDVTDATPYPAGFERLIGWRRRASHHDNFTNKHRETYVILGHRECPDRAGLPSWSSESRNQKRAANGGMS